MISWWWLRHGPTHEKTFVGWRDVPADLSDHGAIRRLRAYLPERAVLVSSDLIRAAATADAVQMPGHDRLPDESALREFNFGAWDGLGYEAVSARDPQRARAYWETPGDIAPPGGESWNAVARRVGAWVDGLNRAGACSHVIAVAHVGVIMTQIQRAGGLSAQEAIGHRIDNLSVTRLDWDGGRDGAKSGAGAGNGAGAESGAGDGNGAGWSTGVINHIV